MSDCINEGHDPKYPCNCGKYERPVFRRNDGFDELETGAGVRAGALVSAWAVIGALLVAFTLILMKWGR